MIKAKKNKRIYKNIFKKSAFCAGVAFFCFFVASCNEKLEPYEAPAIAAAGAASMPLPQIEWQIMRHNDLYYDQLDYHGKKIYMKLQNTCDRFEKTLETGGVEKSDFLKADYAFLHDNPKYFWLWDYTAYESDGYIYDVDYGLTEDTRTEAQLVYSRAEEILSGISPDMSDYEKIQYFYERIIDDTNYEESSTDQDVRSVFIDGRSVCAGYSRAFQYLCKNVGIECGYVEGIAHSESQDKDEPHAWNIVKLDGKWYWIDVTWGDPVYTGGDGNEESFHAYFCVDDEDMFTTHSIDTGVYEVTGGEPVFRFNMPSCTDDSYDYFKRTGSYFEVYDREQIARYIGNRLAQEGDMTFEIKFANSEEYARAAWDLVRSDDPYIYHITDEYVPEISYDLEATYIEDRPMNVLSVMINRY